MVLGVLILKQIISIKTHPFPQTWATVANKGKVYVQTVYL